MMIDNQTSMAHMVDNQTSMAHMVDNQTSMAHMVDNQTSMAHMVDNQTSMAHMVDNQTSMAHMVDNQTSMAHMACPVIWFLSVVHKWYYMFTLSCFCTVVCAEWVTRVLVSNKATKLQNIHLYGPCIPLRCHICQPKSHICAWLYTKTVEHIIMSRCLLSPHSIVPMLVHKVCSNNNNTSIVLKSPGTQAQRHNKQGSLSII